MGISAIMSHFFKMFLGMAIQTLLMVAIIMKLDELHLLFIFSVVFFIISWVLQFIGHKIEGKKPSFLKDLLFLLIGPLWVLKSLFNVIGVKV